MKLNINSHGDPFRDSHCEWYEIFSRTASKTKSFWFQNLFHSQPSEKAKKTVKYANQNKIFQGNLALAPWRHFEYHLVGWKGDAKNAFGMVLFPPDVSDSPEQTESSKKWAVRRLSCILYFLKPCGDWWGWSLHSIVMASFRCISDHPSTSKALSTATLMVIFGMPLFSSALRQIVFGPFLAEIYDVGIHPTNARGRKGWRKIEIPEPKDGIAPKKGHCHWEKDHANRYPKITLNFQLFHFQSQVQINHRKRGRLLVSPSVEPFKKQTTPLLNFHWIVLKGWFNCINVGSTVVLEHVSLFSISFCKKKGSGQSRLRGDNWTCLKCEMHRKCLAGICVGWILQRLKPVDRTVQHCSRNTEQELNIRWRLKKDGTCLFWFQVTDYSWDCEISILPRWSSHGGNGMISQLRRLSTPDDLTVRLAYIINKCIRLIQYT